MLILNAYRYYFHIIRADDFNGIMKSFNEEEQDLRTAPLDPFISVYCRPRYIYRNMYTYIVKKNKVNRHRMMITIHILSEISRIPNPKCVYVRLYGGQQYTF